MVDVPGFFKSKNVRTISNGDDLNRRGMSGSLLTIHLEFLEKLQVFSEISISQ
jgi:hypothetical protein